MLLLYTQRSGMCLARESNKRSSHGGAYVEKGLLVACVWQSGGGCVSLLGVFAAETGRVE